jgi:hypothetical protein
VGTKNRPKRDKQKPKLSKPLKRKLHISDRVWTYDINSNGVRIRTPSGDHTSNISHYTFTGWHHQEDDSKAEILPSDVVGYIRREFLETDPEWSYDYNHSCLRFAEKHGIDLLRTNTRIIKDMMAVQREQDKRDKRERERFQAHLVMENLDLLLQLTHHQLLGCSDEKPLDRGIFPIGSTHSPARVECTRCYLLCLKSTGKHGRDFQLRLAVLRTDNGY